MLIVQVFVLTPDFMAITNFQLQIIKHANNKQFQYIIVRLCYTWKLEVSAYSSIVSWKENPISKPNAADTFLMVQHQEIDSLFAPNF